MRIACPQHVKRFHRLRQGRQGCSWSRRYPQQILSRRQKHKVGVNGWTVEVYWRNWGNILQEGFKAQVYLGVCVVAPLMNIRLFYYVSARGYGSITINCSKPKVWLSLMLKKLTVPWLCNGNQLTWLSWGIPSLSHVVTECHQRLGRIQLRRNRKRLQNGNQIPMGKMRETISRLMEKAVTALV